MFRRIIALILAVCTIGSITVGAQGYYYNRKGDSVVCPDAYIAGGIIDGVTLGIGTFDDINDLYVAEDGTLYIADTGNNRIVVVNSDNTLKKVITEVNYEGTTRELAAPEGVFFRDGELYVCDTGKQEILILDDNNNVLRVCGRPDSASLPEDTTYKPSKVVVNSAGSIFVQANGIYQGLVQYGPECNFINFFGATEIEVTTEVVIQNVWKSLFSESQREGLTRTISSELNNIYIDSEDFVFTVTAAASEGQVRRLNAAGANILKFPGYDDVTIFTSGYNFNIFGDQESDYTKGAAVTSNIVDVHIDDEDIIAVLDKQRGKVFLYDIEMNPLVIFGGKGDQVGYFTSAVALEKRGTDYLIADEEKNTITIMEPTSYIEQIRESLAIYKQGLYEESVEGWEAILELNPSFTIAYRSIGRAYLQQGDTIKALEYLREGDDRYYYSLAMSNFRRDFIRDNWQWALPVLAVLVAAIWFVIRTYKKWINKPSKKDRRKA